MINFTLPAGADALRVLFRRSTDAPSIPYTLDNFSLYRLDTVGRQMETVCSGDTSSGSGVWYRYGFNGKENDKDVKGDGDQQDYGARIYDPRVGRFLSVDPVTGEYPELTPYQFASNRPIDGIDQDGLEFVSPAIYKDEKNPMQGIEGAADLIVGTVVRWFQRGHAKGKSNYERADNAQKVDIKDHGSSEITTKTKVLVYIGGYWFDGGVNNFINPIENAKDAKKDFQNGHYLMGTLGIVSIIPGLGELKALKFMSAESKALIKTIGRFEHAVNEIAIVTKTGIFSDAVTVAKELTGVIPKDAAKVFGKQGILKGKLVGYEWKSSDGVFKRIRLDHDLKVGTHINVSVGKQDYAILVNMGENQAQQLGTNEIMKAVK
jgi:RHS repeat-associated protein